MSSWWGWSQNVKHEVCTSSLGESRKQVGGVASLEPYCCDLRVFRPHMWGEPLLKTQENGTCCFCVHVLDFLMTSLCCRISVSKLRFGGIGEMGDVQYSPFTAWPLRAIAAEHLPTWNHLCCLFSGSSLSLRKGVSGRLLLLLLLSHFSRVWLCVTP